MGVNGKKEIYNEDGVYMGGYISPEELVERLNN